MQETETDKIPIFTSPSWTGKMAHNKYFESPLIPNGKAKDNPYYRN